MSLTRRRFLKTSGAVASGLLLGFYVPPKGPRGYLQAAEPFAPQWSGQHAAKHSASRNRDPWDGDVRLSLQEGRHPIRRRLLSRSD